MHEPDFFTTFVAPLEKMECRYLVTGSVAAILYGEPRLTHDIDIVLQLPVRSIPLFCAAFPEAVYYCPPPDVIRIEMERKHNAHFNLIHQTTGLKADCYPFSGDDLHVWAFRNRKRMRLDKDRQVWMAPPEYVIVRKLAYYKEGGSQKHLSDIQGMLKISNELVDQSFVAQAAGSIGCGDIWKKLKGDNV